MERMLRNCSLSVWVLGACLLSTTWALAQETKPQPTVDPFDWPHWRGPEMNGMSREKGLPTSWDPEGENLVWKSEELATRSTPIVFRGKLYTICRHMPETTQEGEKVVCADASTGKILWETVNNVFLSDAPAERVGWNSVVADTETGNIFFLGLGSVFEALDGETGKVLWSHSLSEEYGLLSTYGGRTNHPTVFEDLVIVSGVTTGWGEYAMPAHRFIAFDKRNGQAVWIAGTRPRPEDTTYSTPILANFNGQAALVVGSGDGAIYAFQPRTGQVIWKYDASLRGINQTPLVVGNTVYCSHGEETVKDNSVVGAVFALKGDLTGDITDTGVLWDVPGLAVARSAPLLVNNRLYMISDGAGMTIHDGQTGEQVGKQKLGTIMFGSAVYGDGKIYVGEATGRWYILEPDGDGVKILHKLRLNEEEILGSPIISHGKIYLPTLGAMYCIGDKDKAPSGDPLPAPLAEKTREDDPKPAFGQLVPVESLLKPGQRQQLNYRLYNANGRYLKTVPAQYKLDGPGEVDSSGKLIVPEEQAHTATIITAEAEGISSQARVRVVPGLPWKFNFNDKQVPVTWIGASYRHQPRDVDGEPMLVKISTIPKGTRSQAWMGPTDLHDYTIQADVMGDIKDEKMPEIGLINQRYTLAMMGSNQALQLRSWTPRLELRFAKTVPFEWKPKTWYVIKFQSENVKPDKDLPSGKVILRGKVWPRDTAEPAEWSIVGEDLTPNVIGSPGLFGNSSDAEIFIDNVAVYDNEAAAVPAAGK